MFTDEHRCEVWHEIRQQDIRAFSKQLTPAVFAEAAKRTGVALVKSPLCLVNLVWLGVSAAVHATDSFATVLTMTLRLLEDQQEFSQSKVGVPKRMASDASNVAGANTTPVATIRPKSPRRPSSKPGDACRWRSGST